MIVLKESKKHRVEGVDILHIRIGKMKRQTTLFSYISRFHKSCLKEYITIFLSETFQ